MQLDRLRSVSGLFREHVSRPVGSSWMLAYGPEKQFLLLKEHSEVFFKIVPPEKKSFGVERSYSSDLWNASEDLEGTRKQAFDVNG